MARKLEVLGENNSYILVQTRRSQDINKDDETWTWPVIFMSRVTEDLPLYPERSGGYHKFVYLQGALPEEFRLAVASVRDGNFEVNGNNVLITCPQKVLYSTGEVPYSGFSQAEHSSMLSRLVSQKLMPGKGV